MELMPTAQDYELLWKRNPLAFEQIKNIVLERMVLERDIQIAAMDKQPTESTSRKRGSSSE